MTANPEATRCAEALRRLLDYVDIETCVHEETHRGGLIWTICDSCGRKWADDEGGFVPHADAPAVAAARIVCEALPSMLKAAPAPGREEVRVRPYDLTNLLRHAFLSGRGLSDDDFLSDDDKSAWAAYDPLGMHAYERISSALFAAQPASDEALAAKAVEAEPIGWAAVYDGELKGAHKSREDCLTAASHYSAIHPVYLGPAWRHQED